MNRAIAGKQPVSAILSVKRINEKAAERKAEREFGSSCIRRLAIELFSLIFNHDWMFWLVGRLNKKLGLIKSVFLMYPANEKYRRAYTFDWRAQNVEWTPWLAGIFWQNGKVGVKFVISANNGQFTDPANKDKLREVADRMEKIRTLLAADHKTFAGILPGVLWAKQMIEETPEANVTVEAVRQVIERVESLENLGETTPIIVLGGRGFIGRRIVASLKKRNREVCCVDIAGGNGRYAWPSHLQGVPVLLVNVSLNFALGQYIRQLWPEVVVINEVYPEPSPELAQKLEDIGCRCYHVVGVKARALPSLPGGYQGGIPCCAAWQSDKMEALFKRIV